MVIGHSSFRSQAPTGSCWTVDMTQPGPDPDNYPPIDPTEPVPDDPGPLSPDTPETLPPAPVEPMPGRAGSCEFADAFRLCEHVNGPHRTAVKGRGASRSPRCVSASPEDGRLQSRARAGHEYLHFRQRRTLRASQREVVHASGSPCDSR